MNWENIEIEQEYIDHVKKEIIDWKQNLSGEIKTRWVGKIGEEAFRRYMIDNKFPFTDLTQNGASWIDFIINFKSVDVKTVARNYYPREDYSIVLIVYLNSMKYIAVVSSGNPDRPYFGKGSTKEKALKKLKININKRIKAT